MYMKNPNNPHNLATLRRIAHIAEQVANGTRYHKVVVSSQDLINSNAKSSWRSYSPTYNIQPGIKRKSIAKAERRLALLTSRGVRTTDRAYKRAEDRRDFRLVAEQERKERIIKPAEQVNVRAIVDYYYDEYLFSEEDKISIERDISLCQLQLPLDWNSFQVEEVITDYFNRFVLMNKIPFKY